MQKRFLNLSNRKDSMGYTRSFVSIVKNKTDRIKLATIPASHQPGISSQIDCKEEMKLISQYGEIVQLVFFFTCFLIPSKNSSHWSLIVNMNTTGQFSLLIKVLPVGLKFVKIWILLRRFSIVRFIILRFSRSLKIISSKRSS